MAALVNLGYIGAIIIIIIIIIINWSLVLLSVSK